MFFRNNDLNGNLGASCFILVSRHFVNDNVFKDENMGTEVHGYLSLQWRTILRIVVPRVFSRVFERLFIFRNEEKNKWAYCWPIFQRIFEKILRPIEDEYIIMYINDIM